MFAINCIECAFLKLRWSPRKIKKSLFKHKSLKYFPGAICYPTNLPNASNDTAVISSISKSPQFHRKCRYALTLLWYIDNIVNIHSHSTKGGFFSESAMCFLDLKISKKNYSKKLSWAWNLNFKIRKVFWNNFFLRFGDLKNELNFLKRSHL